MNNYVLVAKQRNAKKAILSKFKCYKTGSTIFANFDKRAKIVSPFGAKSLLKASKEVLSSTLDRKDLNRFKTIAKCDNCGTHWVGSSSFKKEHDHFNCMVCASELEVIETPEEMNELVEDLVEDEMSEQDEMGVDIVDELQEMVEESDVSSSEDAEEIMSELENMDDNDEIEIEIDEEDLEDAFEESNMDTNYTDANQEKMLADLESDNQEVIEHAEEILQRDLDGDNEEGESQEHQDMVLAPESEDEMSLPEGLEDASESKEIVSKFNLATLLNKKEYQDKIELVLSAKNTNNPIYYLMVNKAPVAKAEFNDATEEVKSFFTNEEIFNEAFVNALQGLSKKEATASLKNFGVKPLLAPIVSNKAALAYSLKKLKNKMEASFKEKEKEMFATWHQCFSIATVSACKGLKNSEGKTKTLTVKATLAETLKSAGIQNAGFIVEEAFKRGIQRDLGHIVDEASVLYHRTPEAREVIASMVGQSDFQAVESPASVEASGVVKSSNDQKNSFKIESSTLDESSNIFASLCAGIKGNRF